MKRGTEQRRLDEALEGIRSGSTEAAAPEATGPGGHERRAQHRVPPAVSEPRLPLPRELARMEQRPFVGRATELQRLRERWSESSRGQGGLAALGGEPGIGKTRLAARFAAEVHSKDGNVLYGRADEDGVVPHQPFVETLRHYAAHRPRLTEEPGLETVTRLLGALVPELGRPPGRPSAPHDRHQLFDAVVKLIVHAASERPLLLVLEDLHWANAPTVLLLRSLARRAAGSPVLVLATYRDLETDASSPLAQALGDLRRDGLLDRVSLAGFDRSETAALVSARGSGQTDFALAERLCDETGGNPFFIEELMDSLADAPDSVAGVPEGIKDVIGRRLDRLPTPALETLTLAAVLGMDFRLSTLRLVAAELATDDLLAALEAAVAARLVIEDPEEVDRFSFAHALVRETLYDGRSRAAGCGYTRAWPRRSTRRRCRYTRPNSRTITSRRGSSAAHRRPSCTA